MLKKLQNAKTLEEIINFIKEFYLSYDNDDYIPALFKEGYFTFNDYSSEVQNDSSEFYSKLIIRPSNSKLRKPWQKSNLSQNFVDGSDTDEIQRQNFIYNVIVNRRMYGNNVYCFNPVLCSEGYIDEENYKNDGIVNAFYFDENGKVPLIKKTDDNLKLYKKALEIYVSQKDNNEYPKYNLSIDFEYRNTINHIIDDKDYITDTEYIDNVNKEKIADSKMPFLWLIGTIDIPFVLNDKSDLDITVNCLTGRKRSLNKNNYNDDMEAGLIVFNHSCLNFLTKRYVVIGMSMMDMFEESSFLIDTMENTVVFWEGEFNKLPNDIKKGLEPYNDKNQSSNIISPAMFEWQLLSNWNAIDNADPFQRLGYYLIENHRELVLEYQCNVYLPVTENDFITQAENIMKILKMGADDLEKSVVPDDVFDEIYQLLTGHGRINNEKKLSTLFQSFALLLLNKVDNDYVRKLSRKQFGL